MDLSLEGKIAIITGSTSGIGRRMALMFAKEGVSVVINSNDEKGAKDTVDEIKASGGKAIFFKADISDKQQSEALADAAISQFGKIDILVNNAGINVPMNERGPIHEFPDNRWKQILSIDLDGVYYCSKASLKYMTQKRYGKIINISSIVGLVPLRNQCAFAAAKAAVINLTKAMAIELADFGINVNAILPGSVNVSGMYVKGVGMYDDNERFKSIMSHIPLKKPGTPQDIGYGALYLASDVSSYVTGNVLVIDGGWTCGFARDW